MLSSAFRRPRLFCDVALLATLAAAGCGGMDHATTTTSSSGSGTPTGSGGAGTGGGAGAGGGIPADVISASPQSIIESETQVAVAPSGVVGVTWIAEQKGTGSTTGYVLSTDGGATWGTVAQASTPAGGVASDPTIAADAQSGFYLAWLGFQLDAGGEPTDMHVYVAAAGAGATTFGPPVPVSDPTSSAQFDKPWMTITNKGTIFVTYANVSTGGIYAARSTDQGKTWGTISVAEDFTFHNLAYTCAPATGDRLWVTYHTGASIGLRRSDDDGATWLDADESTVSAGGETPGFDDPTCAADGDEVWVSYGLSHDPMDEKRSPRAYAIRLAHSSDAGATIDYRADAHDGAAGKFFMHPQLVREAGGALHLVYYAGQADLDAMSTVRRSTSMDGGKTWAPSVVVHQPVTLMTNRVSDRWLGDYVGVAWQKNELFMSYADNAGASSHIGFAKTATP